MLTNFFSKNAEHGSGFRNKIGRIRISPVSTQVTPYPGTGHLKIITIFSQWCGSGIFNPDPGSWFISIPDPGSNAYLQRIKGYILLTKLSLSSQKYGFGNRDPRSGIRDLGSEIWDPICGTNLFRISDPGPRSQKGTGSGIRNTVSWNDGSCEHCCGSGSGIRCLFDPWIRDLRWVQSQHPDPGSGMNNLNHIFWSLETIFLVFFGLKYLNSLMRIRDPGYGMETVRIRDPGWKKVGSGINIPDPQHCLWVTQKNTSRLRKITMPEAHKRANVNFWISFLVPALKRHIFR